MGRVITEIETKLDGTTIHRTIHEDSEVSVDQHFHVDVRESDPEPHTVTFIYHGSLRVVENPTITKGAQPYTPLLSGIEVTKDGINSGQFKHFYLDEIYAV